MTLQLLISTLGREGIGRVARMSLPRVPGVSYLVSWQMPEGEVPEELKRDDLKIVTMSGRGLSRNRNNALGAADGDLLMIADDDCHYTAGRLQAVVDFFETHPDADAAVFNVETDGAACFPSRATVLERGRYPKGFYVMSIGVVLRRRSVPDIRFDERFGLGCGRFGSGEEELLIDSLLRRGWRVYAVPDVVVTHLDVTTAVNGAGRPGVQRASGAVICRLYGVSALPRLVLKAWRLSKTGGGSLFKTFYNVMTGAMLSLFMDWNDGD